MQFIVNDQHHNHTGNGSITALLKELGAQPEHAAITVNGTLIFSKDWSTVQLQAGDTIEVLTFVGGG